MGEHSYLLAQVVFQGKRMSERDQEKMILLQSKGAEAGYDDLSGNVGVEGACDKDVIPMIIHVRPDLYRAFMRCVWMLIHEEGMSPLEAQNALIEDFLRHHGC